MCVCSLNGWIWYRYECYANKLVSLIIAKTWTWHAYHRVLFMLPSSTEDSTETSVLIRGGMYRPQRRLQKRVMPVRRQLLWWTRHKSVLWVPTRQLTLSILWFYEWCYVRRTSYLLLNLRSPRDYVGRAVRACGSVLDRKLLERLMSPYVRVRILMNRWFFRIFGIHIFQVMASLFNLV